MTAQYGIGAEHHRRAASLSMPFRRPPPSSSLRAQAAARLLGARGPISQGRVSIQRRARRLRLPGREVADATPPRPAARAPEDRLRQPDSLWRLPAAPAMHERRPLGFRLENEDAPEPIY